MRWSAFGLVITSKWPLVRLESEMPGCLAIDGELLPNDSDSTIIAILPVRRQYYKHGTEGYWPCAAMTPPLLCRAFERSSAQALDGEAWRARRDCSRNLGDDLAPTRSPKNQKNLSQPKLWHSLRGPLPRFRCFALTKFSEVWAYACRIGSAPASCSLLINNIFYQ